MPELADTMYCSEQICIPPTFPYLLRQYAKAAIRTQPTDLLKWSTAYFRCLSLNLAPPVKPRLEYPIPRDFFGVTPGWLKALMYQLSANQTVSFKILWDRWTGSCLPHNVLIQILCLAGFEDPMAVPWLRFVAICAAHLTDDLTHTMILVCEIFTEEPEGGSAMISYETFVDIYRFLARIDASQPQVLKNKYFLDSLLDLWRKKEEKLQAEIEDKDESIGEAPSTTIEEASSEGTVQEEAVKEDLHEVISCPSIPDQTLAAYYYLGDDKEDLENLEGERSDQETDEDGKGSEGPGDAIAQEQSKEEGVVDFEGYNIAVGGEFEDEYDSTSMRSQKSHSDKSHKSEGSQKSGETEERKPKPAERHISVEEPKVTEGTETEEGHDAEEKTSGSVAKDQTAQVPEDELRSKTSEEDIPDEKEEQADDTFHDEKTLQEDLERLKHIQEEMAGETDEELEKFKSQLIEEMPITRSIESAIEHYKEHAKEGEEEKPEEEAEKTVDIEEKAPEEEEEEYENVPVPEVPGIGGIVPEDLIEAVCEYMKKMAKIQHGMVMPRNIRHYSCPPLEVLKY